MTRWPFAAGGQLPAVLPPDVRLAHVDVHAAAGRADGVRSPRPGALGLCDAAGVAEPRRPVQCALPAVRVRRRLYKTLAPRRTHNSQIACRRQAVKCMSASACCFSAAAHSLAHHCQGSVSRYLAGTKPSRARQMRAGTIE